MKRKLYSKSAEEDLVSAMCTGLVREPHKRLGEKSTIARTCPEVSEVVSLPL